MYTLLALATITTFFSTILFQAIVISLRPKAKTEEPGPALLPWIGRIHDVPREQLWLKLKEWADIHGPIYRFKVLSKRSIVVSDESIAKDLLVKRADINSSRPTVRSVLDTKAELGSLEYLPLMGKNENWLRQRRWAHSSLREAVNNDYDGAMVFEVKRWMYRLLAKPDDFSASLEDMASKIICTLTYGDHSKSQCNTMTAYELLKQISPAGPITNRFTLLWHFPRFLNPWKKFEHERHAKQRTFWKSQLLAVEERLQKGVQKPCWATQYLTDSKGGLSDDHEASSALGMLCIVGVFTVGGPLHFFLLAMVHHQEWLARCQTEIDTVCGDRLPSLKDVPNLPVLRACIRETMRWRPSVPLGVAHEAEEDQYYGGVYIDKGSRIIPLEWAFCRNPVKYPDPESFRPERWLEPGWPTFQEPLTQHPVIRNSTSFGWGQRACLGSYLAQDELCIALGAVCWTYNLKFKTDTHGHKVDVPTDRSNSWLIIKPAPFEMVFEARSDSKKAHVTREWMEAAEQELVNISKTE